LKLSISVINAPAMFETEPLIIPKVSGKAKKPSKKIIVQTKKKAEKNDKSIETTNV
jgi:hypothetical protein